VQGTASTPRPREERLAQALRYLPL
jgi:hypothetical protein